MELYPRVKRADYKFTSVRSDNDYRENSISMWMCCCLYHKLNVEYFEKINNTVKVLPSFTFT